MKRISILFFTFWIFSSFSSKPKHKTSNWISVDYIQCLEKQLPCECQQKETYSFINLDTLNKRVTIHENIVYDPNIYDIKKISNNTYQLYYEDYIQQRYKDTLIVVGQLETINGKLYYTNKHGKKIIYINYGKTTDDNWAYYEEHVRLINKTLTKHNNPTLETILKQDSLHCNCNPELGTINLVSGPGKNAWILEKRKDSLFVYKWTNMPDVKSIDLKIKKKLLTKIKYN